MEAHAETIEAAGDFLLSEDQLSNFKKILACVTFPIFKCC